MGNTKQKNKKNLYQRRKADDKKNLEIQQGSAGAKPKRSRYYSGLLDMNTLDTGEDFENLPECYVIFIADADVLGGGKRIYHMKRTIQETGRDFGDQCHVIYVNAGISQAISPYHHPDAKRNGRGGK